MMIGQFWATRCRDGAATDTDRGAPRRSRGQHCRFRLPQLCSGRHWLGGWAWGKYGAGFAPIGHGHGEQINCPLPKPIESLRGVKVDAVATGNEHTLALADDGGSVYTWGNAHMQQGGVHLA
jgi:hypothetical protein